MNTANQSHLFKQTFELTLQLKPVDPDESLAALGRQLRHFVPPDDSYLSELSSELENSTQVATDSEPHEAS